MGPAEIAEIAEMGPSQMANKGRTDGTESTERRPSQMAIIGHTDITDSTDIKRPSQMAFYMGVA